MIIRLRLEVQRATIATARLAHVRFTAGKEAFPNERLTKQQLDILLGPALRWQRLQEHHDLLEIHALQFVGPLDQERGTYVQMES